MRDFAGAAYDPSLPTRNHVESWFFKANDHEGHRAVWIKGTILAWRSGAAVAQAWAIAFDRRTGHVAAKQSFSVQDARFSRDALDVALPCLTMTRDAVRGDVAGGPDGNRIAFDVKLEEEAAPLLLLGAERLYTSRVPSSKVCSPVPDLRASGTVDVAGERWELDAWPGMLGHNWGRGHGHAYAWGHCNAWEDAEDLIFEGLSGRITRRAPTITLLALRHRGVRYELTAPAEVVRSRGEMTFRHWKFHGAGPTVEIAGELWSTTEDMVGLHYENPSGAMTYCLNSKLASARLEVRLRGRAPMTAHSRRAALEIGTRSPEHGTRMVL